MNINELKKRHEEMGKEIERLEAQQREPNDYELYCIEDSQVLYILYSIDGDDRFLGCFRESSGSCKFLSSVYQHINFKEWHEHGCKVADVEPVEFMGGKYVITKLGNLNRTDVAYGYIYDFKECQPKSGCEDKNIPRHPNGTVKIG